MRTRIALIAVLLGIAAAAPWAQPADLVTRAYELADKDQAAEAIALVKQAIAADPADVRAHAAYLKISIYYVIAYDRVRAEYDALMAREPQNPVYPMALALAIPGAVPPRTRQAWLARVVELAPESAWGHYAASQLAARGNPPDEAKAARELQAATALAPSTPWTMPAGVQMTYFGPGALNGVSRSDPVGGRALKQLFTDVRPLDDIPDPVERVLKLQAQLKIAASPVMERFIREWLFKAAEQAGDLAALIPDGDALMTIDPMDAAIPARMALAIVDRGGDLAAARRYAAKATSLTSAYHAVPRPPNNDAERFANLMPEAAQHTVFDRERALALEAEAQVACKAGDCARAEPLLRESVALNRSERNLSHLAGVLRALKRTDEADVVAREAAGEFARAVRGKLIDEPAKDFEIQTIDGRTMSLASLKGKAVLISFWGTWCAPCHAEMPDLVDLYKRVSARGLEILAITNETPADRAKIDDFVAKYRLPFPVLYGNGTEKKYDVSGWPTTIGIDRSGRVRYRASGYFAAETRRTLDIVVEELLKQQEGPASAGPASK